MQRPLRVHWSHTVPDWNVSFSEVEVEQGVSTVVECCKPEWIDKGWKCYTGGRGLVGQAVDPYDQVDDESDDSGAGAYIISCTPSGQGGSASSSSSAFTSPYVQYSVNQ